MSCACPSVVVGRSSLVSSLRLSISETEKWSPYSRIKARGLRANDGRPTTNDQRLTLGQRNTLPVIVQHIFHFHRNRRDVQNLVTAIDNIAFPRNEHIFTLRKEDSFRLARLVGQAKKLQVDGGPRTPPLWVPRRLHTHRDDWPSDL